MRAKEFDTCYNLAEKMYKVAKKNGGDPELIQVAGYKGDPELADERWQELPPKYWHHYVVVDGGTVYDPSHKQFGNKDLTYPKDILDSQWNKVYKIK